MARKRGAAKKPVKEKCASVKLLTADAIIEHLENLAQRTKLKPGTRAAREAMQITMDGLIIDSLNLKRRAKTKLHALVAKRIRILQAMAELEYNKTMSVNAALIIYKDEKSYLSHYTNHLLGRTTPERRAQIHAKLRGQIALLEGLKAAGIETTPISNIKIARSLLTAANSHNIYLRNIHLGPEIDRFEHLRRDLMDRFLDRRFP
ncbi:MAG: hypothetical protein QGI60_00300 [archaeon]|jgi:hypothetical protein|nr:hypothetical protein [archaeon]